MDAAHQPNIFFLRHGKLQLPYRDHSEMPFSVLADLACEKLNPPIDAASTHNILMEMATKVPFEKIEKIYHSPSPRAADTAQLIQAYIQGKNGRDVVAQTVADLKEVSFDLRKIMPTAPQKIDIKELNNRVLRAMAEDRADESLAGIQQRVHTVLEMIKNQVERNDDALFISHDFFMRFLEVALTSCDLQNTQRNTYLRGFATDSSLSTFQTL